MNKDRLKAGILTPVLAVSLFAGGATGIAALASAQTSTTTGTTATATQGMRQMGPHVGGTITAISGSMITVSSEARGQTAATTYTIDAANATVTKDGAASTLASLAVGDKIFADGTLNGTTLTATKIMNGFGGMGMGPGGEHGRGPGVMGTVSAVSGNTVTVTNSNGTSYTIDATNAKVSKMVDLNVSDIKVGDTVGVQGTVSGTSVTATHIMDGVPQAPQSQ